MSTISNIIRQKNKTMGEVKKLGALVGDIIGSTYEFWGTKRTDFNLVEEGSRVTDDSVMTLAVAKWLLEDEAHNGWSYRSMCVSNTR